jgi:hypothetical protein
MDIDLRKLCSYHRRNPDFHITEEFGYDEEEINAAGNFAKKDCACDDCFYGRSKLTEQLIQQTNVMYSEEEVYDIVSKTVNMLHPDFSSSVKDMMINELFGKFEK